MTSTKFSKKCAVDENAFLCCCCWKPRCVTPTKSLDRNREKYAVAESWEMCEIKRVGRYGHLDDGRSEVDRIGRTH